MSAHCTNIPKELMTLITGKLRRNFGRDVEETTSLHMFKACALVLRDMSERPNETADRVAVEHLRQVHYLSLEFLMGRSLMRTYNLGVAEPLEAGHPEGLGFPRPTCLRPGPTPAWATAAWAAWPATWTPATGIHAGLLHLLQAGHLQAEIVDGQQVRLPDNWLGLGDALAHPQDGRGPEVRFGGKVEDEWDCPLSRHRVKHTGYDVVLAVPKDMEIAGYGTRRQPAPPVGRQQPHAGGDARRYSSGQYPRKPWSSGPWPGPSDCSTRDNFTGGKSLRLKQQYLLHLATIQSIVRKHRAESTAPCATSTSNASGWRHPPHLAIGPVHRWTEVRLGRGVSP